jgi:HNH endonuclease
MKIAPERVREALNYDPDTGLFTWRISTNRRIVVGSVAGTPRNGYVTIKLDGTQYAAHRLAWLHVHGEIPDMDIDHKNGITIDNRLTNLRPATRSTNNRNRHVARSDSLIGVMGVGKGRRPGTYRARIKGDGGEIHLGTFSSIEAASEAYQEARSILHKEALCA